MSYDELWSDDVHNKVSAKDRLEDMKFHELKVKVNESDNKFEKLTTNFEPLIDEDVVSKCELDAEVSYAKGHKSPIEKT